MHIEKKTVRNIFFIAVGAIAFYWILNETDQFRNLWTSITDILAPFVLGAALAFIMNVPMRPIERQLKFIRNEGLRRALAIVLTLVAFVAVIAGVILFLAAGNKFADIPTIAGIGTIITAFFMGPLIELFNEKVARPLLNK